MKDEIRIAAATLGRIKSAKKAASSRENGKKGGRPTYKFSVLYARGSIGTPGRTTEIVTQAATTWGAIEMVKNDFDDFGKLIPKYKFKYNDSRDGLYADSGNWEESICASRC